MDRMKDTDVTSMVYTIATLYKQVPCCLLPCHVTNSMSACVSRRDERAVICRIVSYNTWNPTSSRGRALALSRALWRDARDPLCPLQRCYANFPPKAFSRYVWNGIRYFSSILVQIMASNICVTCLYKLHARHYLLYFRIVHLFGTS